MSKKTKRKKISKRDVLDGRKPGQKVLGAGAGPAEGWFGNGHWVVSLETHDPGELFKDKDIAHESPLPMAEAFACWGNRDRQYARTKILIEREDDVLLRLYRGPENAWLAIPEHHARLALGDAPLVWAPAPSKPGQMVQALVGLEHGTGLCHAVMTVNGLGREEIEEAGAFARDVEPWIESEKECAS